MSSVALLSLSSSVWYLEAAACSCSVSMPDYRRDKGTESTPEHHQLLFRDQRFVGGWRHCVVDPSDLRSAMLNECRAKLMLAGTRDSASTPPARWACDDVFHLSKSHSGATHKRVYASKHAPTCNRRSSNVRGGRACRL